MDFIRKCVDDVVPTITIRTYPNQKPWMNEDIHIILRALTAAFNVSRMNPDDSIARNAYKASRSIRDAKRQCRLKLYMMFDNSDSCRMWQGLQTIPDYKGKSSCAVPTEASLASRQTIPSHSGRLSLHRTTR